MVEILRRYIQKVCCLELTKIRERALLDLKLYVRHNFATCNALNNRCFLLHSLIVRDDALPQVQVMLAFILEVIALFDEVSPTGKLLLENLHKDDKDF